MMIRQESLETERKQREVDTPYCMVYFGLGVAC